MTKQELLSAIQSTPAGRSAWSRAVKTYATELVESLADSDDLSNEALLVKALLNGAGDWQQYSEGGCALIYDADIAGGLQPVRAEALQGWRACTEQPRDMDRLPSACTLSGFLPH